MNFAARYGGMSETRRMQMEECDRIKRAFQRAGLSSMLSAKTLQRALVVPEDRADETCRTNLPVPGSSLSVNPLMEEKIRIFGGDKKSKKKGKKGKKKKGKKGKKKKKKKKK